MVSISVVCLIFCLLAATIHILTLLCAIIYSLIFVKGLERLYGKPLYKSVLQYIHSFKF